MQLMKYTAHAIVLSPILLTAAAYTWPNPQVDYLEDVMYVQSGYHRSAFLDPVNPCSFSQHQEGRMSAAEWIRTAFHDASTHNIHSGTGGLDVSVMWETEPPDSAGGVQFNSTLSFILGYHTVRSSMSDLLALATYTAIRACGGPAIPVRFGRLDATGPSLVGTPKPEQDLATFTSQFAAAGFNTTDMIKLVACGHTLGGVHGSDFPDITGDNSSTNYVHFDDSFDAFDTRVVTQYLDGTTTDPLVVGPPVTNSDLRVFEADGNVTIRTLADPTTFKNSCRDVLQRMIDAVPSTVTLTQPIDPLPVKPTNIQLTLNQNGTMAFAGDIRVLLTGRSDTDMNVTLHYADHHGKTSPSHIIQTTVPSWRDGIGLGFDHSFKFFSFSKNLPASGISHFNVSISSSRGTEIHSNGGKGFPIQDSIMFQGPQSCLVQRADSEGKWNLTVVAAVRDAHTHNHVFFNVVEKTPRQGVVAPKLSTKSIRMRKWQHAPGYTLYSAQYRIVPENWVTTFDVVSGSDDHRLADEFKWASSLPKSCASF